MNEISSKTGFGFSFGYIDDEGRNFSLASGKRSSKYFPEQVAGDISPDDKMLLGSGTKPFTAIAIMKLVEQGKVNLDDPAMLHIDAPMKYMWNTTLCELYGPRAANITVRHLIFMQSGLEDFETRAGDFDK